MPIYEFMCPDCRSKFTLLLKPMEHPGGCPYCIGHPDLHKQLTAPASFKLKGEGFYKPSPTDDD